MNQNSYKEAFNSVKFSEDFEQKTIQKMLCAANNRPQKENEPMNIRKIIKVTALAMVLVAVVTTSAFAVSYLLSAKDVATHTGNNALAQAFESSNAVEINQTLKTNRYDISLLGIVSGKGLTGFYQEAEADKSYIVASVAYHDGRAIQQAGETNIIFSPFVSGYKPWQVNAWTLGGGYSSFVYEGVNYFVFECSNLEIFADHTVYLAAYEGNAPDCNTFQLDENGEIRFTEAFDKAHAIFTLPLDSVKADAEAVKNLLNESGIVIE